MPACAEGAPVEHKHGLPVERPRLRRLVEIDGERALDAVAREIGLRHVVGERRAGEKKKSERCRCDLHVYQTIVYARSLHSAANLQWGSDASAASIDSVGRRRPRRRTEARAPPPH